MNELEMYNFMSDEDINLFNKKSGIYGLIHNDKVVYVGQSKNIRQRLKAHREAEYQFNKQLEKYMEENGRINRSKQMKLYKFLTYHKNEVMFVIFKETEELNKWEEHYITLFKPQYNLKGVDIPY